MREVKEVAAGAQFSRSSENGRVADSGTRAFKILMDYPGEVVNLQQTCGVYIGSPHPFNPQIFCASFDARYDGESRMVILCTFQYASAASSDSTQDNREKAPDIRPANWSVASSIAEAPAHAWLPIDHPALDPDWQVPANPVGDRYDGVTRVEPVVTFSIEQYESVDPTRHTLLSGVVNSSTFRIGNFSAPTRSLMFRGVQCQPTVESWGPNIFRGWKATYEFLYRKGYAGKKLGDIGWDIAIPQTGFSVKAFAPPGNEVDDAYGQPLKHGGKGDPSEFSGRILEPLALPPGITADEKVRAMIKVFSYENGGASQLPSAQPIPMNDNGRPRKETANPKVLLYRYQVQDEYDFNNFGIRLF